MLPESFRTSQELRCMTIGNRTSDMKTAAMRRATRIISAS